MLDRSLLSKLPHLQQLPAGWRLEKFGTVTLLANGQVSPQSEQYRSYIHVGPENIESESGRLIELRTAEDLGLSSGKYVFDEDAIVYSKIRPNLNKVCLPGFKGICSADAYPIWPIGGNNIRYLLHFMRSELFLRQAVAASMRTGLPKINRSDLFNVVIVLPPPKEQKEIASVLDDWELYISGVTNLLNKKRNYKKALMQQLLTGKRRLPGFARLDEMIQTRYGRRPLDWPTQAIGDFSRERNETNGSADLRVLSCTKHEGLVDSLEYFEKRIFSQDTSRYKIVRRGQFAYATNHIEEGSIGLLTNAEAGLVSPMYTVFEVDDEQADAEFLYRLFKTELYRHIFEVNTNASVNRRGSLRWTQFSKLPVALPSLSEQKAIAEVLNTVDRELELLECQLELYKKQKRGLMQKLLTGQIRVKETSDA